MELNTNPTLTYITTPGTVSPQGATLVNLKRKPCSAEQAIGVNFAVYAPAATQLFLALFDETDTEVCLPMFPSSEGIWHLFVEGLTNRQLYGFRADGQWSHGATPRFNRHKLLLDPYARELKGKVNWSPKLFDYVVNDKKWGFNSEDSACDMPRCVVRDTKFDWQGVEKPNYHDQASIIYETHLKGFTKTHPEIPEELRGTYLGMCHTVTIAYLKSLGITAVELLPVTSKVSEERLVGLGLENYWGYNTLCFMAPEPSYGITDPVIEMKTMVRELHRAGIEVIMDVVFNHTCEAGHNGPFLSMRGLAENDYYHMDYTHGGLYALNYSGCGNTCNFDSPQTLRLTMDALRLWVEEYQIDGFRFDLAPTMARVQRHFSRHSPFLFAIAQDPVLSQAKMIAEPWDIGPNGYHVSGFPKDWQSWNDRYRDGCRKFWRGDDYMQTEMANRFGGSEDMFHEQTYLGTVNYICSHDGFNLMDLVSYNKRHNLANKEDGRDGDEHNHSCNHGCEGPTDNSVILEARLRTRKNLIAMLMLSKGTPMLLAGDEFGNSQQGNNNAYCQDSKIAWMDWSWLTNKDCNDSKQSAYGARLQSFTREMIHFRRNLKLLTDDLNNTVYQFYTHSGRKVEPDYYSQHPSHGLTVKIRGIHNNNEVLIVLMNPGRHSTRMHLPMTTKPEIRWRVMINTNDDSTVHEEVVLNDGWYEVAPNCLVVLAEID